MSQPSVFISHASQDDPFVKSLRQTLEKSGATVWADSRELIGGDVLQDEILQAITIHDYFFIVVSPHTFGSKWVKKELEFAKSFGDKRIVALLLDGQPIGALAWMFDEEPLAIPVSTVPGGLQQAMPDILAALGLRLPDDAEPTVQPPEPKVNDLLLVLENPMLYTEGGLRRGQARAHFEINPADSEKWETPDFNFICPLGPIEAGRMKWYIEDYPQAPFLEKILDRGAELEREMAKWGKQLFDALTDVPAAREMFWEWKGEQVHERRFSVKFNFFNEKDLPADQQEAISLLMATPWEILHDGQAYLFQGKKPVRVRRQLPNKGRKIKIELQNKLRILLLSPRPVDEQAGYIDHRVAPKALLAATEMLGDRAELTLLTEPTFSAMCAAIDKAEKAGQPFSVVHFDGHGVFDAHRGLGALCFESNEPGEQRKLEGRKTHLVYADELLAALRDYRIPFFFLDACQSAVTDKNPTASVAATLLETGVASVAAMSYSVLVRTAEEFAKAFYAELARGARIGSAMLAGQRALHDQPVRAHLPEGEKLRLQDWFVPVLFQEEKDPQLVKHIPGKATQQLAADQRKASAGFTPEEPKHGFIGRRLELLALERLLLLEPYAVLVGQGGAGKTTLATELARWMLRTGRFQRLAFVSFEGLSDTRSALDSLGRQLDGSDFSVAKFKDEEEALLVLDRRLREFSTLIVLDNLESVLPEPGGVPILGVEPIEKFMAFFARLQKSSKATRLLLTTRETLPAPFNIGRNTRRLGPLSEHDALHLIASVRDQAGYSAKSLNVEDLDKEFGDLARSVNYHARALTLLAQLISERGEELPDLNADLSLLMAELERKSPGERENSLFASLELSLRRLSPEVRTIVDVLAVYNGGADVATWAMVTEQEQDVVIQAGMALVAVGLAEVALDKFPYYFKIDPALPAYLSRLTPPELLEERRQRWVESMEALSRFLREQQSKDMQLSSDLSRLAEANLLAMLAQLEKQAEPEQIVNAAQRIESLFANLGRSQVVLFAQKTREKSAVKMSAWNHAQFQHKDAAVNRFLEQGNLNAAYQLAKDTLEQCERAGKEAYPESAYDCAMVHFMLGRVLSTGGQPEKALPYLEESRQRFSNLTGTGSDAAARMASKCLTEIGDCFLALGQYDAAAKQYEMNIETAEKLSDSRQVAVGKGQLATARMYQKDYTEALRLYAEAKDIFERYREPGHVAIAWHQIGRVHQEAKNYPAAEKAYQESLAIEVREKNKVGEASSLGQLGNFYQKIGRLEDAVRMFERAVAIAVEMKDLQKEGTRRSNLADTLLKLHRSAEARIQLLRAIECKSQFGHAALPWTTWIILYDLEIAEGNLPAAAAARQKAMQAYAAYRKDGGESQGNQFNFIMATAQALQSGEEVKELSEYLQSTLEPGDPTHYVALINALLALLRGSRDSALADDPELDYRDAVDLRMVFFGEG